MDTDVGVHLDGHSEYFLRFALATSGAEVKVIGPASCYSFGLLWNAAILSNDDKTISVEESIRKSQDFFESKGRNLFDFYFDKAEYARVAPLLKKAGASDWGTVVGMEAPLHAFSSMKSSDISDINLEIRLVSLNSDDSTIQAYYTLLATAFLEGEELPHNMSQEQYENELAALSKRAFWDNRINRPEWKRWIGFVDGKPAATVALWNRWAHLGVTTLMDVTVAEQYRRRGIAKRMITHALTDISGLAGPYHKCILQAEPDAVPVYLSLGFKPTCEISVWEFDTDDT